MAKRGRKTLKEQPICGKGHDTRIVGVINYSERQSCRLCALYRHRTTVANQIARLEALLA